MNKKTFKKNKIANKTRRTKVGGKVTNAVSFIDEIDDINKCHEYYKSDMTITLNQLRDLEEERKILKQKIKEINDNLKQIVSQIKILKKSSDVS